MYCFLLLLGNVIILYVKFCGISKEWQFKSIGCKFVKGYKYEECKMWIDLGEIFLIKIFLVVIKYFMFFQYLMSFFVYDIDCKFVSK